MKKYYLRSAMKINTVTKILILSFFILATGYLVQKFFQYWNFQSPVLIQIRLPTLTPTSKTSKAKTEREIIMAQKHGEILWKIYGLETTWGKNDYCRPNGYGGFGVMNTGQVVCYESFEKAVDRAEYWLTKNGVDKDLAVSLCLWNEGVARNDCPYYKSYLTL